MANMVINFVAIVRQKIQLPSRAKISRVFGKIAARLEEKVRFPGSRHFLPHPPRVPGLSAETSQQPADQAHDASRQDVVVDASATPHGVSELIVNTLVRSMACRNIP
jgi:hypothetical protein